MTTLVIAEHDNVSLKGGTLNALMAAAHISMFVDGQVHLMVIGHDAQSVVGAAQQIAGVAKVIHVDDRPFANALAEGVAAQIGSIAGNYTHILFASTAGGKNSAPRVAAALDVAQISDMSRVISADTFERQIYASNAVATVQSRDVIKVITVRTTSFDASPSSGGSAAIETLPAMVTGRSATWIGS